MRLCSLRTASIQPTTGRPESGVSYVPNDPLSTPQSNKQLRSKLQLCSRAALEAVTCPTSAFGHLARLLPQTHQKTPLKAKGILSPE